MRGARDDGRAEERNTPLDGDDELSVGPLEPRSERPPLAAPLRRVWRWSGLVAFVTLAAIIVVAVAPHIPRSSPARAALPYTALHVSNDVTRCLYDFSWSHDSRQITALTSYDCASPYTDGSASASSLYLFDAATGQLTTKVAFAPALASALRRAGLTADLAQQNSIGFYTCDWSPDDRLLAAQFAAFGSQVAVNGVVVVTLAGPQRGHIAIMLGEPLRNGESPPTPNFFGPQPTIRWDLMSGAATTIYLQPSLSYRWLPDDELVADAPLPVSASAPAASGPTGSVADGQVLSLWRTGYVSLVNATDCNPSPSTAPLPSPYALLTLNTIAWSPDDRYLLDVNVVARLTTPFRHTTAVSVAQLNSCDQGPAPDQIPAVSPHDKGLSAALKKFDPKGSESLNLAWSPDGRRLASLDASFKYNVGAVAVYDCANGTETHAFTSDQFNSAGVHTGSDPTSGFVQEPVWSPDSTRLLLVIGGIAPKVIVLGPQALGA